MSFGAAMITAILLGAGVFAFGLYLTRKQN